MKRAPTPRRVASLLVTIASLCSMPSTAAAQEAATAPDGEPVAIEVLDRAAAALGSDAFGEIGTFLLRAEGVSPYVGQGASPADPVRHRRVMRETAIDAERGRFFRRYRSFSLDGAPTSCTATVGTAETAYTHRCLTGEVIPRPDRTGSDDIAGWRALLPHGWVEAARAVVDSVEVSTSTGGSILLTFPRGAGTRTLHIDPGTGLPTRVEGKGSRELGGEVVQALGFDAYRSIGEWRFPSVFRYVNPGGFGLDVRYTDIEAGATLPDSLFSPPEDATWIEPSDDGSDTTVERLAEGVLLFEDVAPTYNTLVVQTGEGVAVIDAPVGAEVSRETLERIEEAFPGRRVRWVIPTHFHHDHLAGLAPFVEAGATVLTTRGNVDFVRDLLVEWGADPAIEVVSDRRTVGHGSGELVLHAVDARPHVDEMIVAWLPEPGILYQADLFWTDGPLRPLRVEARALTRILRRLELAPRLVSSAHWGSGTLEELRSRAEGPDVARGGG